MKFHPTPLVVLGLALAAPAGRAQTSDAKVDSLVSQVAAAYRNLASLSATLDLTQGSDHKAITHLTLQKPLKFAADVVAGETKARVVADGKTVYTNSTRDKAKYIHQSESKLDDAMGALAQNGGAGVGLLPILLTSATLEQQIIPGKPTSVKCVADETVGSDPCDVIAAVIGEGEQASRFKFAFSKQDHLLRQLSIGPAADGAKPTIVETYSDVNLHPTLTTDTFKYMPPAGAIASEPPKAPPMYDQRLKVGAMPIAISGNDLAGKPVSLEQYKGKVLLIDFWATWCVPCVAELPNVISAYKKYHSKGFDVVGVSLDQANSQAKVTSFIQEKGMPWRQIYDGKYWQAANAKAYGVMSIPFTLLVGTDGKIAAVGARGEDLAPAIEAALNKH